MLQKMCEYEVVSLIFESDRELVSFVSYTEYFNCHSSMHIYTYICAQFIIQKS